MPRVVGGLSKSELEVFRRFFAGEDIDENQYSMESSANNVYLFECDVNLDGKGDYFLSSSGLLMQDQWLLYLSGKERMNFSGMVGFDERTIRIGKRDGVMGYYRYSHAGAGEVTVFFTALDEGGKLVETWKQELIPEGQDKEYFSGIFDNPTEFVEPQIFEFEREELAAHVAEYFRRVDTGLPHGSLRDPNLLGENDKNYHSRSGKQGTDGAGEVVHGLSMLWGLAGFLLILALFGLACLKIKQKRLVRGSSRIE